MKINHRALATITFSHEDVVEALKLVALSRLGMSPGPHLIATVGIDVTAARVSAQVDVRLYDNGQHGDATIIEAAWMNALMAELMGKLIEPSQPQE
jgi:hypothetical protein